jgi:hypothetical protein
MPEIWEIELSGDAKAERAEGEGRVGKERAKEEPLR